MSLLVGPTIVADPIVVTSALDAALIAVTRRKPIAVHLSRTYADRMMRFDMISDGRRRHDITLHADTTERFGAYRRRRQRAVPYHLSQGARTRVVVMVAQPSSCKDS